MRQKASVNLLASCTRYRMNPQHIVLLMVLLPLFALVLAFAFPGTALADSQSEVRVDVIPASVDIPDTGQVEVQVALTNLLSNPLQNVQLSWFTNAGVKVINTLAPLPKLAPAGQYVWTVQLAPSGSGPLPGTIQFRVDYQRQVQGQSGLVNRVAFGTLTVQSLKPQTVEQVVEVQVVTSLVSLDEQHPGTMYLLVTNKSDFTVTINRNGVTPRSPNFITLTVKDTDKLTIPPRQQRIIAVDVNASNAVQTGKQTLVFEVAFQWDGHPGNVVASQQIDVGVLGESQLLTLLDLPSLLLLPGFLALITIRLLRQGLEQQDPDKIRPKLTTPEFWFWAIMISALVGLLYPYASRLFLKTSRSYLELGPYGLADIVYVWIGSVALALVAYFLWFGITRLYSWYHARQLQEQTLTVDDKPVEVLRKLEKLHRDIALPYVTVNLDGDKRRAFLLEPYDPSKDELWVSPAIVVQLHNGSDPTPINKALKERDIASLLTLLGKDNAEEQTVQWRSIKEHDTPFKAKVANIANTQHSQFLVEVELDAEKG